MPVQNQLVQAPEIGRHRRGELPRSPGGLRWRRTIGGRVAPASVRSSGDGLTAPIHASRHCGDARAGRRARCSYRVVPTLRSRHVRPTIGAVLGRLEDGTPYFAPLGELPFDRDEDRVQCHLCGGWYRALAPTHLSRAHGVTVDEYRDLVGLRPRHALWAPDLIAAHGARLRSRIA